MWSQFSASTGQRSFLFMTKFCTFFQGYCILEKNYKQSSIFSNDAFSHQNSQAERYMGYYGGGGVCWSNWVRILKSFEGLAFQPFSHFDPCPDQQKDKPH